MELKATLKDYTAAEFGALVDRIWAVDLPKQDHDRLINHFDAIVGHPEGADLLFYPDDRFGSNNAGWVVYLVRNWHQKQGISAFKGESSSLPPPPIPINAIVRVTAEVQKVAALVAVSDRAVDQAFAAFEQAVRNSPIQLGVQPDISAQETNIRTLERVQRETLTAIRKFERLKMGVEFAKNDAQRNLTYARSEQAQWQSIAQQINATHSQYIARLTAITQRHRIIHDDAEALLGMAQEQLIRSRNLAKVGPAHAACVINGSLNFVDKLPAVLLKDELSALQLAQRFDLQKSIRSAVAEFTWKNISGEPIDGYERAAVLQFEFISRADSQVYGVSVPLTELMAIEGQDWHRLAAGGSNVDVPFRMGSAVVPAKPGTTFWGLREVKTLAQVHVTAPQRNPSTSQVRVRAAQHDEQLNSFSFTADGTVPITLYWSAAVTLETSDPIVSSLRRLGSVHSSPVPMLETISGDGKVACFDDYVVVFPVESGLDPVYVMFRNWREYPI